MENIEFRSGYGNSSSRNSHSVIPSTSNSGSSNLVLKNLQAFLTCKRSNPNYASATAAAAGTLLSLSLVNNHSNSGNYTTSGSSTCTRSGSLEDAREPFTRRGSDERKSSCASTSSSPRKTTSSRINNSFAPTSIGSYNNGLAAAAAIATEESKRSRSANYSALEKEIFVSIINPYRYILEDKRFDSETLQEKAAAWKSIVIAFNSHRGVVRRDRKQLKELWKRLKDRARKNRSVASGSGTCPSFSSSPSTTSTTTISGYRSTSTTTTTPTDFVTTPSTSKLMKFALLANAAGAGTNENGSNQSNGSPRTNNESLPLVDNSNSNESTCTNNLKYVIPLGSSSGQIRLHAGAAAVEVLGEENQLDHQPHHMTGASKSSSSSSTDMVGTRVNSGAHARQRMTDGGATIIKSIPSIASEIMNSKFPKSSDTSQPYNNDRHRAMTITNTNNGDVDDNINLKDDEQQLPIALTTIREVTTSTNSNFNFHKENHQQFPIQEGNNDQGGGRHQSRELTPEGEDMKHVIPTPPPPLKEHMMSMGSLQSQPPLGMHSAVMQQNPLLGGLGTLRGQLAGGAPGAHSNSNANNSGGNSNGGPLGSGGSNFSSGGPNSTSSPPPTSSSHPASSQSNSNVQLKESSPQQLLCVRWGNYDSNIISMFSKLKSQESFVDVTLWCEGKTVKCHKIILSACSTYFETLLTETPNSHPIIFLKDMKFWEIQALVEFMYKGEVSIHQEKLQNLLRAAESLQIKGLGSPSNDRNGFGLGAGAEDNNRCSSPVNSTGDDNEQNSMDELSNNSGSNQTHRPPFLQHSQPHLFRHHQQQHQRSLYNSPSANMTNSNSLLKNSQYNLNNSNPGMNNSMGIDLSNHGKPNSLFNNSSSVSPHDGNAIPAKRRKKETPRKIGAIPSLLRQSPGIPQIPLQYAAAVLQQQQQQQQSEEYADDDAGSVNNESMDEDESHLDVKPGQQQRQAKANNEDSHDEVDGHERFTGTNFNENEQGTQSNDEFEQDDENDAGGGDDGDGEFVINEDPVNDTNADEGDGDGEGEEEDNDNDALDLGTGSNSNSGLSDQQRERSRKGNPIKKIQIGNNNNNYTEDETTTTPSLIQTSTD